MAPNGARTLLPSMLVDTGAAVTVVRSEVIRNLGLLNSIQPANRLGISSLVTAGGAPLKLLGCTELAFHLGDIQFSANVLVADDVREMCLLGADVLTAQGMSVCLDKEPKLIRGLEEVHLNTVQDDESNLEPRVGGQCQSGVWGLRVLSLLVGLLACICHRFTFWYTHEYVVFRLTVAMLFVLTFGWRISTGRSLHDVGLLVNPAHDPYSVDSAPSSLPVSLCHDTVLSPRAECLIVGSVACVPGDTGYIDSFIVSDAGSLLCVPCSIVTVDTNMCVPIVVANMSSDSITISRGTVIAQLDKVVVSQISQANVDCLQKDSGTTCSSPLRASSRFSWEHFAGSDDEKVSLCELIDKCQDVVAMTDTDVGKTRMLSHEIDTGAAHPIRQASRRLPPGRLEIVSDQIGNMLDQGIIEPSTSPWASPIVLVRKSDNTFRFCVDYRKLNAVTHQDAYPLPRIDETLDNLGGAQYCTSLDLQSGYWQVPVMEKDREKTAFVCPQGLYQFCRMPFGLTNAPATFQRLMNAVLSGLSPKQCLVYLDDVIVFSSTFQSHLVRLENVLQAFRSAGLKLKPKKCKLLCVEVNFLGHVVSRDGIGTDPKKTSAVSNWPVPTSVKTLQSFLGFCNYYRRFVRNFAQIAEPLYNLLGKDAEFVWSESQQKSFDQLRILLSSAPVLAFPKFGQPFILDTDASTSALGAVLSQVDAGGVERPIAFLSRTLSNAERNYNITRLELLAVVWACRELKPYLVAQQFLLRTDHGSLRWLMNFKNPSGQVARWLTQLAEFSFTIEHRPGAKHANADGLSRRSDDMSGTVDAVSIGSESRVQALQQATAQDPVLSVCISRLKHGESCKQGDGRELRALLAQSPCLEVRDNLLYRITKTATLHQLVVPFSMRNSILGDAHGDVTSGHFGQERTLRRVSDRYYWPGMSTDVQLFCQSCMTCAQAKDPPKKPKAPLGTVRAGYPFEAMAMDVMGPLPVTSSGNKYILVVADYFSKWIELIPCPNITAATVASKLMDVVFCRYGVPEMLHSDQGSNFESKLIAKLCGLLGIRKTRTTPYHPQSDGMVERANKTIQVALKCYLDKEGDCWDQRLKIVQLAYNTSVHSSTGFTPYFVLFGREATLPLDLVYPNNLQSYESVSSYVTDIRKKLALCFNVVSDKLNQSHRVAKKIYDREKPDESLQVGDYVWLYSVPPKGVSSKFFRHWTGPWQVQRIQGVVYSVVRVGHLPSPRHARELTVHRNRLKKVHGVVSSNQKRCFQVHRGNIPANHSARKSGPFYVPIPSGYLRENLPETPPASPSSSLPAPLTSPAKPLPSPAVSSPMADSPSATVSAPFSPPLRRRYPTHGRIQPGRSVKVAKGFYQYLF